MEYLELIEALSRHIHAEQPLETDPEGVLRLEIGGCYVSFYNIEELQTLLVTAAIAEIQENGCEALKNELLKANFAGGVTGDSVFSLSSDCGVIYFHHKYRIADMDFEDFIDQFTTFLQKSLDWRKLIETYASVAEKQPEQTSLDDSLEKNFKANFKNDIDMGFFRA